MSKFLKVVVNIILICAILVAGGLLIPPFAGVTTVVVDDVDMDTNLSKGSVTYALEKDSADLKEGNKILVSEGESQYVYEIASISGDTCTLEDKLSTDGGTQEKTLGARTEKVYLTIPFIGYVSMALRSTEGLIIVGLAVVFVIILFILAEIWKKDGDEEEGEDDEDEDDEDEDEEEDEEAPLSRRERKKAAKAARKAAKKADEEVWEEPAAVTKKDSPVTAEQKPVQETAAKEEETDQENRDLFEETRNTLAADIASMMGTEESPSLEEPKQEETPEEDPEVGEPEMKEEEPEEDPVERRLAMPVYTKEELLRKAKAAGEEPEVVEDEASGVTILDYSDIL